MEEIRRSLLDQTNSSVTRTYACQAMTFQARVVLAHGEDSYGWRPVQHGTRSVMLLLTGLSSSCYKEVTWAYSPRDCQSASAHP